MVPHLTIDETLDYGDEKVWKLFHSGFTKNIFQCESKLVQHWLKQVKPNNIWELSAVIAGVRPGSLKSGAMDDFVAYRTGAKKLESFGHPVIDEAFSATDGVMFYQETLMQLGSRLAWVDLEEKQRLVQVDILRKGVGKKDQAKLNAIGKEFVDGCTKNELDKDIAEKLFEIIKNCGRYLFNLSHSIAYAYLAYKTAYLKVYHPNQFTATYLTYAKFVNRQNHTKWEETNDIVQECRILGIDIFGPNVNYKNGTFLVRSDGIYYGLESIKYFGSKTIDFIKRVPEINDWRQFVLLCNTESYGEILRSQTTVALIVTGAFQDIGLSRRTLLSIYNLFDRFTARELEWVVENIHNYSDPTEIPKLVTDCIAAKCNKRRAPVLESELRFLQLNEYDHPAWIEEKEKEYLGVALSATALDSKENLSLDTCRECSGEHSLYTTKQLNAVVDEVILTKTKKGKNPGQDMARISVHDSTGELKNLPVFPEQYARASEILMARNTVSLSLSMGKFGWIVESVNQL